MDDMPVAVVEGSTLRYIETDHLNTPRALIDPARNLPVWRWDLQVSAFGEHAANEDPDGDATLVKFNLRFPGQYLDAETGLHYNYFRDYEPGTGRYVESDPIGLRGGLATFGYALSSPLSWKDQSGGIPADPFDAHCGVENGCLPVPTWPNWGPPSCKYYDDKCGECPSDSHACNARKCCESFGNKPSSNCTRRCLIISDAQCTAQSGDERNRCRFRNHVRCYVSCRNYSELLENPLDKPECADAMQGMGGPFGGYLP
jgi:RHS repeat-associated protein